jgi:myo-inositol-1(or 4)-monophosphatase
MAAIVNIAINAVRRAGAHILRERDRLQDNLDIACLQDILQQTQEVMHEIILKANPYHHIVGSTETKEADVQWHIEVSGLENFARKIPHFAIVIVIEEKAKVLHTVVYDPYCDEIFVASLGNGAKCNQARLRVNSRLSFDNSIIGNYCLQAGQLNVSSTTQDIHFYNQGCDILAMAYVAAGRFDAFVGNNMTWAEVAAGALLIKEAGGLVADLQGGHQYLQQGELVACYSKIFKLLLQMLLKSEETSC